MSLNTKQILGRIISSSASMVSDMVKADHHLFNEQDLDLESLIELIRKRKHVARPIPTQTQP